MLIKFLKKIIFDISSFPLYSANFYTSIYLSHYKKLIIIIQYIYLVGERSSLINMDKQDTAVGEWSILINMDEQNIAVGVIRFKKLKWANRCCE